MHVTTVFSGRFQDLLLKMGDRAQHTAIWCQCSVCASHFYEYLHIRQVEVKFTMMFLYVIGVFITFNQGSFLLFAVASIFGTRHQILMRLLCLNAAHWALSAIIANPPPSFRCRDDYQMCNKWINNQLSFCSLCLFRPCQPIVFVSDRARANIEIEHDGIQGEKKKPKVTIVPKRRYTFISKKRNSKKQQQQQTSLWPCHQCHFWIWKFNLHQVK